VARLASALVLLTLITAAPAAADAPAVTLAPLPGEDACLSQSAGDAGCTPIRKQLHEETRAFELSGDGRHAYLLSWGYGYPASIHLFSRNRFDGALTEEGACWSTAARDDCAVDPLLEDASDLAISPDRQHVYVVGTPTPADGDDNGMPTLPPPPTAVLVFARNASSGGLTRVQCLAAGDLPGCEQVGDLGEYASGATVSPDGRHVYIGRTLFDRDPATGRLSGTRCAYEPIPDNSCPDGSLRAMASDGRFAYAVDSGRITTYARDPASGALSQVDCPAEQDCRPAAYDAGPFSTFDALTVAPDGRNVYALGSYWEKEAWLYDMDADPGTGLLTERGCFHSGGLDTPCAPLMAIEVPAGVSATPDGQAVYVGAATSVGDDGGISMFARDPVTGRLTWAGCITRDGSRGTCVQSPTLGSSSPVVSPDSRNVYLVTSRRISVLGLAVDVRAQDLQVSDGGAIRPRLVCPTGVTRCEGRIVFKRRGRRLARKQFSIPGGQATRVRVRLSQRGRERVRRRSRLRVNAKLTADAVPGRTVRSMKLERR
jgi:hypothetical protein